MKSISSNEEKMMRGRKKSIVPLFGLFLGICNRRQSRFSVSEVFVSSNQLKCVLLMLYIPLSKVCTTCC